MIERWQRSIVRSKRDASAMADVLQALRRPHPFVAVDGKTPSYVGIQQAIPHVATLLKMLGSWEILSKVTKMKFKFERVDSGIINYAGRWVALDEHDQPIKFKHDVPNVLLQMVMQYRLWCEEHNVEPDFELLRSILIEKE